MKLEIFCLWHKLTGLYCPGCGITRMFLSLFKGNIYQAFRYNPLVFILLPFLCIYFIEIFIARLRKKDSIMKKIPNQVFYILIAIVLVYGLIRNVPYFDYLKPTEIN